MAENTYTLEEVEKHTTEDSLWTVVDGGVYDLTDWVKAHPGGAGRILDLGGHDSTMLFFKVHGDAPGPNGALENFRIGSLA